MVRLYWDPSRVLAGIRWGLLGAAAMVGMTILVMATGHAPSSVTVQGLLVDMLLPAGLSTAALVVVGAFVQIFLGALMAAALTVMFRRVRMNHGIVLALMLWILEQLFLYPMVDWGVFGTQENPWLAGTSFMMHLAYGMVLGAGLERYDTWSF